MRSNFEIGVGMVEGVVAGNPVAFGKFKLNIAAAALAIGGCATAPVPDGQAVSVPLQRVAAPDLLQRTAGSGVLVVTRDAGATGAACYARLHVDGRSVADISTSERIEMYLPAGEHILSMMLVGSLCGGGLVESAVVIDPAKPKRYRVGFGGSMEFRLQPTAF